MFSNLLNKLPDIIRDYTISLSILLVMLIVSTVLFLGFQSDKPEIYGSLFLGLISAIFYKQIARYVSHKSRRKGIQFPFPDKYVELYAQIWFLLGGIFFILISVKEIIFNK